MVRHSILVLLSLLLAAPAMAQRHTAPPAPDTPRKQRRKAPPSAPNMPVRKPAQVSSIMPTEGPPGSVVTIHGAHFDETCGVRFNGRNLKITERTNALLRVRIVRGAVTDSLVVTKAGFRDVVFHKVFHVVRPPRVTGFKPRKASAGAELTVLGSHFLPKDKFMLGQVALVVAKFRADRVVLKVSSDARTNRIELRRDGKVIARSRRPVMVLGPPPVLAGFSPARGVPGTMVRIEGKNFLARDWVELSNRRVRIKRRGEDFFEILVGRRNVSGKFEVTGPDGRRALSANIFEVVRPPKVVRYYPKLGPPGTQITFEGHGFLGGDTVSLGQAVLTTRTLAHNKLVVEVPAGVATGPLFINRGGQRWRQRGVFQVQLPPAITSVTPGSGPPGTHVIVQGHHFLPGTVVLLAGQALKQLRRPRPNQLKAVIPPNARTGRITVQSAVGVAQSPVPFSVVPFAVVHSFFPLHGLPGATVTVRGAHFHKGVNVFIGKLELPIERLAHNEVVVKIPKGAPSGKFVIETFGRKVSTSQEFRVDQPTPELAFDFRPKSGRRGREVMLLVTPPRPNVIVFYNGRPLPKKTLEGGRKIIVTIPGDARSGHFELEYKGDRYKSAQPFRVR